MNIFTQLYEAIAKQKARPKQQKVTEDLLNSLAEKEFPITDELLTSTGWLLSNGSCVDLGGGGSVGRGLDHREINRIFMDLNFTTEYMQKNQGGNSGYMLAFMDIAKAVRCGLSSNGYCFFNIIHPINNIQGRRINDYIIPLYNHRGEIEVQVTVFDRNYVVVKETTLFDPEHVVDYLKSVDYSSY